MFKRVIIITGTPGVGKTRVSKALAKRLNNRYINLTEIALKHDLVIKTDPERETAVVDLEKLSKKIQRIVDKSNDVIIDGHYMVDIILADDHLHVFVLRINPIHLKKRLHKRNYDHNKIYENLAAEILDVCLINAINQFGLHNIHEIDVTEKNLTRIIDEVITVIDDKATCKVGVVDWLGTLEKENRVDEFLI